MSTKLQLMTKYWSLRSAWNHEKYFHSSRPSLSYCFFLSLIVIAIADFILDLKSGFNLSKLSFFGQKSVEVVAYKILQVYSICVISRTYPNLASFHHLQHKLFRRLPGPKTCLDPILPNFVFLHYPILLLSFLS